MSLNDWNISPDWWKNLFDEVYLITDARSVCDEDITRREIDLFCTLLPVQRSDRILDLCGGHGRHSLELCARGFIFCTLLDYSHCLVKKAKENAERHDLPMTCVRADARKTGLLEESYHHVLIAGNALGYLTDACADKEILEEAWRLLKPGGWSLVDITNGDQVKEKMTPRAWHEIDQDYVVCRERDLDNDTIRARELVLSKEKGMIRDQTYAMRLYTPIALKALMEEVGYDNVQIHTNFSPHSHSGDYGFMNCRMIATGQKCPPEV
jgi:D-alanine-D-alanine ligase